MHMIAGHLQSPSMAHRDDLSADPAQFRVHVSVRSANANMPCGICSVSRRATQDHLTPLQKLGCPQTHDPLRPQCQSTRNTGRGNAHVVYVGTVTPALVSLHHELCTGLTSKHGTASHMVTASPRTVNATAIRHSAYSGSRRAQCTWNDALLTTASWAVVGASLTQHPATVLAGAGTTALLQAVCQQLSSAQL